MSDRPSPYDAGLGPVSNSPGKLESSRRRRSLHNIPPCTGLTEIIFWKRTTEGPQVPRGRLLLCLTEQGVCFAQVDSGGVFRTSFHIPVKPLAWAEWPEGPTTDDEEDFLDSSTGTTGDETLSGRQTETPS